MAALLIYDINSTDSAAHPSTKLANPFSLFAANGFHGGMWRTGWKFTTLGVPAVLVAVFGMLVQWYLTAYNAAQACGWAHVFFVVFCAFNSAAVAPWDTVGPVLSFWQNLALLEVVHSLVGAVRAPWHSTLLQISSRVFVVALLNWLTVLQTNSALYIIGFAWSITEVIRYSWYALTLLEIKIRPFTLLRYSTFLPLYPIGVYGELALVYAALPSITGAAGVSAMAQPDLPEFVEYFLIPVVAALDCTLETVFTYVVPALYAFGLPFLYSMLLASRNNVIKKFKAADAAKKAKQD
jgi:very-long-chain (3R)-3-hydroxyacyl-CoA dehydratase